MFARCGRYNPCMCKNCVCIFALVITFSPMSWGATIAVSGTQYFGESWQPQGIGWRDPSVVKNNDIDGDNVFGTDGYFLAKTVWGAGNNESYMASNFDTSQMTSSTPTYLSSIGVSDTQVNHQTNYGYRSWQDPNNLSSKLSVGFMGRSYSSTLVVGDFYSLYDFTLGASTPSDISFTVLSAGVNSGTLPFTGLRLEQIGGSGSDSVTTFDLDPTVITWDNAAFITFSITGAQAGDEFRLYGQANNPNTLHITGMAFDSVAIPEPSSPMLLILGALTLIYLRKMHVGEKVEASK